MQLGQVSLERVKSKLDRSGLRKRIILDVAGYPTAVYGVVYRSERIRAAFTGAVPVNAFRKSAKEK